MFNLVLLQLNGSRKRTRYKLGSSPFVIGRSEACDLSLSSRTVSRKHCEIVFDQTRVIVRDLNSRNGTEVAGEVLSDRQSSPISHHDVVTVGKYSFRVSIRDAETNRPVTLRNLDPSTLSGVTKDANAQEADQLLSELDALASQITSPKLSIDELSERAKRRDQIREKQLIAKRSSADGATADLASGDRASGDRASGEGAVVTPSRERGDPDETAGIEDGGVGQTDSSQAGTTCIADVASTGEFEDEVSAEHEGKESNEPRRLPEHLRRRNAKDSQGAASQALRNLFLK